MILLTREYKSCDCKSFIPSVHFDYRQYSILIFPFNGLLVVYDPLHLISTWFAWISHRISGNCFFLLQYLSIFSESTLVGVSVYIQVSTLDAQSKALEVFRTDYKITNKMSRIFLQYRTSVQRDSGIDRFHVTSPLSKIQN